VVANTLNQDINQMVVWDEIIVRKEDALIESKDVESSEYVLNDISDSLL
jgi:hypothetical protein